MMNEEYSDVDLYVSLFKRLEECWKWKLPFDEESLEEMEELWRSFDSQQIEEATKMIKGD